MAQEAAGSALCRLGALSLALRVALSLGRCNSGLVVSLEFLNLCPVLLTPLLMQLMQLVHLLTATHPQSP